jgi:hypothetical protein
MRPTLLAGSEQNLVAIRPEIDSSSAQYSRRPAGEAKAADPAYRFSAVSLACCDHDLGAERTSNTGGCVSPRRSRHHRLHTATVLWDPPSCRAVFIEGGHQPVL